VFIYPFYPETDKGDGEIRYDERKQHRIGSVDGIPAR
jgi:hypothetical protein